MLTTEHTMPDGEVRLYCLRHSSMPTYVTDDGEGGCLVVTQRAPDSLLPDSVISEVRSAIIAELAQLLHCMPDQVQRHSLSDLRRRLVTPPEPPAHPWQTHSRKPFRRPSR